MGIATTATDSVATGTGPIGRRAPRWLRAIFIANLVAQCGIIVTGGLVRLTASGLGCPTWPQCAPGSYVPTANQAQEYHKYIEFGNRTLTFVLALLAIAALVGALIWNRRLAASSGKRTVIVWLAAIPLLGTVAQALLGGITVLTGLNPISVSSHFLVSAAIIYGTLVLVVRANEPGDQPRAVLVRPQIWALARVLVIVAAITLTLGTVVTGSGPHAGDVDAASRLPFDPRSVSWLHADVVLLFLGLTVGIIVALAVTDSPARSRRLAWLLLAIILCQGLIGYLQYFTGLPWLVVLTHLLGSCLVWVAVVALQLSMRSRGVVASPAP